MGFFFSVTFKMIAKHFHSVNFTLENRFEIIKIEWRRKWITEEHPLQRNDVFSANVLNRNDSTILKAAALWIAEIMCYFNVCDISLQQKSPNKQSATSESNKCFVSPVLWTCSFSFYCQFLFSRDFDLEKWCFALKKKKNVTIIQMCRQNVYLWMFKFIFVSLLHINKTLDHIYLCCFRYGDFYFDHNPVLSAFKSVLNLDSSLIFIDIVQLTILMPCPFECPAQMFCLGKKICSRFWWLNASRHLSTSKILMVSVRSMRLKSNGRTKKKISFRFAINQILGQKQ